MGRLIDYRPTTAAGVMLAIRVGDIIIAAANGARVRDGGQMLEVVGPLKPALVGDNGEILSPMDAPNSILIHARAAGRASLELIVGDIFMTPRSVILDLDIGG